MFMYNQMVANFGSKWYLRNFIWGKRGEASQGKGIQQTGVKVWVVLRVIGRSGESEHESNVRIRAVSSASEVLVTDFIRWEVNSSFSGLSADTQLHVKAWREVLQVEKREWMG
jgi:hypothetical protein